MKKIIGFLVLGCFCFSVVVFAESDLSNIGKKLKSFGKDATSGGLAGLSQEELEALVDEIIEITIDECRQTPDCEEFSKEDVAAGTEEVRGLLLENPQMLEEAKDSDGKIDSAKLIEMLKNQSRAETDILIAETQIVVLKTSLALYELDNGFYPSTSQGLLALIEKPTSGSKPTFWNGPYVEKMPEDPWGNSYHYIYPGIHNKDGYDLSSYGLDEIESDDDITN